MIRTSSRLILRTESSRLMRGARKADCEYLFELCTEWGMGMRSSMISGDCKQHDAMRLQERRTGTVGCDGMASVIVPGHTRDCSVEELGGA